MSQTGNANPAPAVRNGGTGGRSHLPIIAGSTGAVVGGQAAQAQKDAERSIK